MWSFVATPCYALHRSPVPYVTSLLATRACKQCVTARSAFAARCARVCCAYGLDGRLGGIGVSSILTEKPGTPAHGPPLLSHVRGSTHVLLPSPILLAVLPLEALGQHRSRGVPLVLITDGERIHTARGGPENIGKKSEKICRARIIPNVPRGARSKTFSAGDVTDKKGSLFPICRAFPKCSLSICARLHKCSAS